MLQGQVSAVRPSRRTKKEKEEQRNEKKSPVIKHKEQQLNESEMCHHMLLTINLC